MTVLRHEFVESAPRPLEPGVVYVSTKFGSVLHLCCCGCGAEVVTPLSADGWQVIFDGKTVTLEPSVANSGLDCRSHYCIVRDSVRWHEPLSDQEVARVRHLDTADLSQARQLGVAAAGTDPHSHDRRLRHNHRARPVAAASTLLDQGAANRPAVAVVAAPTRWWSRLRERVRLGPIDG